MQLRIIALAYLVIQFLVLPSVPCECYPKVLELLYRCLFQYRSIYLQQAHIKWLGFLETWSTSVLTVLIFISAVSHSAAKLSNTRWRPDSVEAESNHPQMAGNWFCSFQSRNTHHWLGYICWSNSGKVNNNEKRKQNAFAWGQRLSWKHLIDYHLPCHKIPVGTTEWLNGT